MTPQGNVPGNVRRTAPLRGDVRLGDVRRRDPSAPEHELEFARIWKATPKVVFSRTLDKVEGNATLAEGDVASVHPVLVGGGTPFFPPLDERIDLRLVETRTFGSGAVRLRYKPARSTPPDATA